MSKNRSQNKSKVKPDNTVHTIYFYISPACFFYITLRRAIKVCGHWVDSTDIVSHLLKVT